MYRTEIVFPQYIYIYFHSYRRSSQFIHHQCVHKHHIFSGRELKKGIKNKQPLTDLVLFHLLLPLKTSCCSLVIFLRSHALV